MPIDASIPLQVQSPKFMTPAEGMSLQNVARQGQLQQLQLEQAQQEGQQKNQLRQVMQGAADPTTGRLNPDALARITNINPQLGLQLGHQQEQLRLQDLSMMEKKTTIAKNIGISYVSSYDRYLQQTGGNKEEATRLAKQNTLSAIDDMEKRGELAAHGLDSKSISGLRTLPDPESARTTVISLGGKVPDMQPRNTETRKIDYKGPDGRVMQRQEQWNHQSNRYETIPGTEVPRAGDEAGKAPVGYRFSKAKPGDLEPIPGGPAAPQSALSKEYSTDPEYKKGVDFWANFVKDGGTLPARFAQSGAGKKMMPDITNVIPTLGTSKDVLANQVEITGQKAEARAVGTKAANVEMAAGEAREMMPILQKASENFERTGYQPINKVFKAYQDNTGSVESRQFGAALNSFVNVYARAVSPSGTPTVSDKDHAREVLSTADSHKQLLGLLKILDQEMVAAQSAPKRVRAAQREGITGKPGEGETSPASAPAKGGWKIERIGG